MLARDARISGPLSVIQTGRRIKMHMFDPTRDANCLIFGENGDNNHFSKVRRQLIDGTVAIVCEFTSVINGTLMNLTWKTEVGGKLESIDANFFVNSLCFVLWSGRAFALQAAALQSGRSNLIV